MRESEKEMSQLRAPRLTGRRIRGRGLSSALFFVPAALVLAGLVVYPMFQLLRMSVSDVTATTLRNDWEFVGLSNYIEGFANGAIQQAFLNTAFFVIVVGSLALLGGLVAALSLRINTRISALVLAIMVFVWALPPVVNGSVWKFLLADSGLFNTLLSYVGVGPVPFLYNIDFALASVALVTTWAAIPFNALVFRAAILGVPQEVIEAARIDGVDRFQEVIHVIIPAIRPTMLVLSVLTIVYAFRSFDYIYVITFGGPGTATNTLPFLGYLQAVVRFDFGLGAATSVVTVLLVASIAVLYGRSVRREESEN